MSETDQVAGGDNIEASGQDTKQEEVQTEKGYPKHFVDKVLGEKKKAMAELDELRRKASELENEKLESQGKQSELIDSLKKQVAERDQKLNQKTAQYAQNVIFSAIKAEAVRQGCIDPEALIKLADMNSLEVDTETFTVSQEDLNRLITNMATEKAYLFKKQVPGIKDATPGVSKDDLNGKVDLSKLTLAQRAEMLAKASAAGDYQKKTAK